jgi:hypothetical protein
MDANAAVKARLLALYEELLAHDGYGTMKVELRILRRGQKEVIVDCGKQYRFVVDFSAGTAPRAAGLAAATLQEERL